MRYAAKSDDNQAEIVKDLRAAGFTVIVTSRMGHGFPDLIVADEYYIRLVEVKKTAKSKYTEDQKRFNAGWKGPPVLRITCAKDLIDCWLYA